MSNDSIVYTYMNSTLGKILLAKNAKGLVCINFQESSDKKVPEAAWQFDETAFDESIAQLQAYFKGELHHFDLPLAPKGTPFQLKVWQTLQEIPYGKTISYGDLAQRIDKPKAARAVGAANGKNPLPIVIPCHRVIGSNGTLTGYAGGIAIKEALLKLEGYGV